MAEALEANGAKFYRALAENGTAAPRATLLALAAEEEEHGALFAEMRAGLRGKAPSDTYDPENEGARYLEAFAGGHVFDLTKDPVDRLSAGASPAEVLRMAMGDEKDSIMFYLGLRDLVSDEEGRRRIEHIIAEEMQHIARLSERLTALEG